jgi:hypothetical protein
MCYWLIGLLLLVGCRNPIAPEASTLSVRSGSRLRARWAQVDGARLLAGWRDTQLGIDCQFSTPDSSGNSRCLPERSWEASGTYADAGCHSALYRLSNLPFMPESPVTACSEQIAILAAGGAARGPVPDRAWMLTDEGCVPVDGANTAVLPGDAVPASTFALAHQNPERGSARIQQLWLEGEDGSRAPFGAWDSVRQERVELAPSVGSAKVWAPSNLAFAAWVPTDGAAKAFFAADAACSEPVAVQSTGAFGAATPLPSLVRSIPPTPSCGTQATYFQLAPGPASIFQYIDSACGPVSVQPGTRTFLLGAPVDDLAPGDLQLFGDGAVRIRHPTAGGHPLLPAPRTNGWVDSFIDAATGAPCQPTLLSDGAFHCVEGGAGSYGFPDDTGLNPFGLDANCSSTVAYAAAPAGCTPRVPAFIVEYNPIDNLSGDGSCAEARSMFRARVWQTGPVVAGRPHGIDSGTGACEPLSFGPGNWTVETHAYGPELPPAAFPVVTVSIE